MACVENIPPENAESEMEEGEIVDELDDLSDISSGEEFLLRQRLQVLENYNNVLERKKAKRTFVGPGKQKEDALLHDLSEISGTDLDDNFPHVKSQANVIVYRNEKEPRHLKHPHHKQKRRKDLETNNLGRNKDYKKKTHRKKRLEVKVISESSDESDDEYRNKRRKLANAVVVRHNKNDTSSLQDRLQKMLCGTKEPLKTILTEDKETETDVGPKVTSVSCSPIVPIVTNVPKLNCDIKDIILPSEVTENEPKICELIDLCTDDDSKIFVSSEQEKETVDSDVIENNVMETKKETEKDSDDDLELLRQHALKTKSSKAKTDQLINPKETMNKPRVLSEDEDSDTAELRLICLKSAILKKAIEMKQKQKLKKRLSQSSNLQDELSKEQEEFLSTIDSENNNTDIESVDMDIGSDGDEKGKDVPNSCFKVANIDKITGSNNGIVKEDIPKQCKPEVDELEEDEDLLRARLLTSLSKNLPNLVDPNIMKSIDKTNEVENSALTTKNNVSVPEEKRIIINLGESDSEGEHEATKNLTKMHLKLSEQLDFQQKLDLFLKSTRMEVENKKLPDVVQDPALPKTPQKFVAKAVNHLPKSEQMEYKNLVKRMAELEKIKQARQTSMTLVTKPQIKDTLKPRNVSSNPTKLVDNKEEQIALSRKKIAEESSLMLKLKEEATKLSQKYKIVATELRNIGTAITLNKKEQRSVQNRLNKIRLQHQRLLNSSSSKHSNTNTHMFSINWPNNKIISTNKLQKENDPSKEEYVNPQVIKSMKVSIFNETSVPDKLSIQLDVSNSKKTVKRSKSPVKERVVDIQQNSMTNGTTKTNHSEDTLRDSSSASLTIAENCGGHRPNYESATYICDQRTERRNKEYDDYESPLQALGIATWEGDPNAILCPFEVGGNCKDADCKYLHPKIPSAQ